MSTEIKEIEGRMESSKYTEGEEKNVVYIPSTLHITRFFGGALNGDMLQLSINNSEEHAYIQLTKEQVDDLIETLAYAI